MSILNQNSQKSFEVKEVKEVPIEEQNVCYLGTKNGKVTIKGIGTADSIENNRYSGVYNLMSIMESKLDKEINQDISLSYIGLESLVKVFTEMENEEEAIEHFTNNISPRNFFYLIHDIDIQNFYHGSDRIYRRFLSNTEVLKELDAFYNEFEDVLEESYRHNVPCIYAFIRRHDLNDKNNTYLCNIGNAINSKSKAEKELAFNLINEYYGDKTRCYLSESSKEELFYKVKKINDKWELAVSKTSPNKYYNLDFLYDSIDENAAIS